MLTPKLLIIAWLAHLIVIHAYAQKVLSTNTSENPMSDRIPLSSLKWNRPEESMIRKILTHEQYTITQHEGTETPFHNAYWDNKAEGIYVDIVSGEPLFSSRSKFTSGTGWPSFTRPLVQPHVVEKVDWSMGYERIEVRSLYANSHLGHVFKDDPGDMGWRYCINSAALRFVPKKNLVKQGYSEFIDLFEY
jgi:methionine-R-sulfoxide reductase